MGGTLPSEGEVVTCEYYSITELETLAMVAAIYHFMFYLYGAPMTIIRHVLPF